MRTLSLIFAALMLPTSAISQSVDPARLAAIDAAADGWAAAYALATDPVTTDVLTWLRLRDGAGTFAEYQTFVAAHPDWPGVSRLRAASERVIPKGHDTATVIAWFAEDAPQTGEGACLLYTSPSPRDLSTSRMPSSA